MPPRLKAFLVGVNYAGTDAELRGPVNDALKWAEVLRDCCGFPREDVLVMIDEYPSGETVGEDDPLYERPVRENILAGLSWLVEGASAGDVLVFAFSGHAAQLPDGPPWPDGGARLVEALCPSDWHDFQWGLVPQRVVSMDEIHRYLALLPPGVLLTVAVDASVVGSPVRVPLRIDFEFPDREQQNRHATQGEFAEMEHNCEVWLGNSHVNALPRRLPHGLSRPVWVRIGEAFVGDAAPRLNEGLAVFCFAACSGAQTALDASLEGLGQGCMTYCLHQALELLSYKCSYLELGEAMDHIARNLRREVMPYMDQYFQILYGKNAAPDECMVFDSGSAFVASDKAKRRRGEQRRPR